MEQINKLIVLLMAIQNFAKDIHYNCKGESFYAKHLLADKICEGVNEHIDNLKEVFFMAADKEPLPSGEYLIRATSLIPEVQKEDKANFKSMQNLLITTLQYVETLTDLTKGEGSLVDAIAQDLQQSLALVNFQIKD